MTDQTREFDPKKCILISLGLLHLQLVWSLYNTQVNVLLFLYIGAYSIVGLLMTMDNIIQIIFIPYVSYLSDKTRTRFGRRMPYLIVGIPLAAIFFILIGTINPSENSLWELLLWMFFFNLSMALYRGQAISLLPDIIRPQHRSKGNAINTFMASIGSILAYTISLIIIPISLFLGFLIGAIIMLISLILMVSTIHEKDSFAYQICLEMDLDHKSDKSSNERKNFGSKLRDITIGEEKSIIFILLAVFSLFMGFNALEALFTVYAVDVLNLEQGLAGGLLLFIALPFLIFSIPSGYIATKLGRRLTIKIGLTVITCVLIIGFLFQNVLTISVVFIIFGIGWSLVVIHTFVIVWTLAPSEEKIGTYSGGHVLAANSAAIFGPFIIGILIDLFGNFTLFVNCAIFFLIALILMQFVKKGDGSIESEDQKRKNHDFNKIK